MPMITEQHLPALQGLIPACVTTCSAAGEPNTSVISQIWYVDADHVALSNQFFNKTKRNVAENPFAYASIINPTTLGMHNLELEFQHTEAEGDLFDEMEMKLEAIASMSGMSGIFRLLGADVYKVASIKTFR